MAEPASDDAPQTIFMNPRTRWGWLVALALGSARCGPETTTGGGGEGGGPSDGGAATAGGGGTDAEGGGAEGGGGETAEDPCSVEALAEPTAATTYYIAIGEPGADNDACDGLAPTDEGGGHCPFKDFSSPLTRSLLEGVSSVRVELRAGTYVIAGWEGLRVAGNGRSEAERVALSSYQGEEAILDVAAPDGAGCDGPDAPDQPQCVRQVVNVSGQYGVVQGLTIQNGLGYNLQVLGQHTLVRCNLFRETVPFAMRSDGTKIAGGATDVQWVHNVHTQWRSQAIDITEGFDVLIEDNEFFDPFDADGGATGTKLGSSGIVIRNNDIHDLGDDPATHVFSLGGTGAEYDGEYLAHDVHVVGNRVENVTGILAQLVSCAGCSVEDNDVTNISAGVRVSNAALGDAQCLASVTGCLPSEGAQVRGNRFRQVVGGAKAPPNIFVVVDEDEGLGFTAGENVYCSPAADDARFAWLGSILGFDAWVTASGTDETSTPIADSDALCSF